MSPSPPIAPGQVDPVASPATGAAGRTATKGRRARACAIALGHCLRCIAALFVPVRRRSTLVHRVAVAGGSVLLAVTGILWTLVLGQSHQQRIEAYEVEARRIEALAHSVEDSVRHGLAIADGAVQRAGRSIATGQDPDDALRLTLL